MISILGCGWLGMPLAEYFIKRNIPVKGSTTKIEKIQTLIDAGISAHLLSLDPNPIGDSWDGFLNNEILIVNIPPKIATKGNGFHLDQINFLIEKIKLSTIKKIIYISSTSVYPDSNSIVDESGEVIAENAMVQVEFRLKSLDLSLTILRCGGLMGYDRIPGKYFANKEIFNANTPVNFIHKDDVISVIDFIIINDIWNETFNVVSPIHPLRKDVYIKNANDLSIHLPIFKHSMEQQTFKIVNSDKIKNLGFQFKFPNPLFFTY